MNFSPFTTQFAGLPANSSLHQFTTAKFAQNLTASNGQVVSLVSGTDGNVQFLRSVDGTTANFPTQIQQNAPTNISHAQTFILPITMPGEKPGDAQQTVQIQVLNPNQIHQAPKYQNIPMSLPIQGFPQQTVLTVSMPPESEMLPNHGLPEGVTVLAAIQPQDLQLFAQAQPQMQQTTDGTNIHMTTDGNMNNSVKDENENPALNPITIKQEPFWGQNTITTQQSNDINDFIARQGISINLQPYLKFDTDNMHVKRSDTITTDGIVIKQDPGLGEIENNKQKLIESIQEQTHQVLTQIQTQPQHLQSNDLQSQQTESMIAEPIETKIEVDANGKVKKKRKYKKKPPKPKPPKPGQVHIATALDGTILFCCPECQMAYAEKTDLEQHLTVHKIERRYICDICGAGLKRKEHLERHKLGHSPERPHICSVCKKGFKRKEHLNLHFVIHSGDKTEICGECGKGFYRKDHLRKHTKSHITKRLKEEMNAQAQAQKAAASHANGTANANKLTNVTTANMMPVNITSISMATIASNSIDTNAIKTELTTTNCSTDDILQQIQQQQQQVLQLQGDCQTICLHVPTSDNTTVPVQIKLPPMMTTSAADGTTNTVVLQPTTNTISTATLSNNSFNSQSTLSTTSLLP
ncbi:transcription factor E4F1-like isoform X2 [Contarinia nasturtii]|nr:transcription factor E4F1-like isoform X2 [Contarinia nasturtii]